MTKALILLGVTLAVWLVGLPLALVVIVAGTLAPGGSAVTPVACGATGTASGAWRVPFVATGYSLTSGFGMRYHPIRRVWALHTGVDLAAPRTTVVAAAGGTVTAAGRDTAYGNRVIIDHGDRISTLYGHLDSIDPAIRIGRPVTLGQALGVEGSTGYSTGLHLHFTVTLNGTSIDPVPFMAARGAPLDGKPAVPPPPAPAGPGVLEGGIGYELPQPDLRRHSLANPALPVPDRIAALYRAAAAEYGLPWTLLAGIGMEETNHGRATATSSAGARGLMQFMPATFAAYGVDGDGDGRTDITSDADSVYSAANYLVASGATKGPAAVKRALFAYNHADWYVGDVLYYAHAYGGGQVLGGTTDCPPGTGNPDLPPLAGDRIDTVLAWARDQLGRPYVMGADGPDAYDCSSYTRAAYARAGITLPRTAQAQRDWLAAGNGQRITPGHERPGDLIFIDSYLGPHQIGHVALVGDPATGQTLEAASPRRGIVIGSYEHWSGHAIYEIWRVGDLAPGGPA